MRKLLPCQHGPKADCVPLSFELPVQCTLVLHTCSKFVTLWLNSTNIRQFYSFCSRKNQAFSAVAGFRVTAHKDSPANYLGHFPTNILPGVGIFHSSHQQRILQCTSPTYIFKRPGCSTDVSIMKWINYK